MTEDSEMLGMEDAEARGKTADGDAERINEKSKTTPSESAGDGDTAGSGGSTAGDVGTGTGGGSTGDAGGASYGGGSTGDTPNA